jgi:hypothetical protein
MWRTCEAPLVPYHQLLRRELERYGGTVEKFIGDAVMALFGAPSAHEDDPERAVRAALSIQDAVAELREQDERLDLHVRIGVNTGEALVVLGADPQAGEGMASGDVVNTAARLQSAAPADGVLVGEVTYRATSRVIEYEKAEPVQAKGKSEPVRVWVGKQARSRLGSDVQQAPSTPLVGREQEMRLLWEAIIAEIPYLGGVAAQVVASHHERWDGTGYPQGLRGEDIPLAARIFAVVDAYDAMTNDRPYRWALSTGQALKAITSGAGTQFDPHVAQAFIALMREAQAESWQQTG